MWWQLPIETPNIKTCVEKQQKFLCEFGFVKSIFIDLPKNIRSIAINTVDTTMPMRELKM